MQRLSYFWLLGLLIVTAGSYFAFVANVNQSFPTLMLGWFVVILSLQMGKFVLKR